MGVPEPAIAGGSFFLVWLLMMVGMIVGWIIFLFAIWRGMRPHESIADSLHHGRPTHRRRPSGYRSFDSAILRKEACQPCGEPQ
jgi:hypothetical protein